MLNGLETARLLREIDANIDIVICTAFSDTSATELRARIPGNVFYIRKPFVPDEFHLLVHSLVNQWYAHVSLAMARQEIAMQLEYQRLVLEATKVGVWQWDLQADRFAFSERWAEISGRTLPELEPASLRTWLDRCHPDDQARVEAELARTLDNRNSYYDTDCRIRHQDGGWIWVRGRGKVVSWSPDGQPLLMYGTMVDVTERVNREARAARQIERVMLQNRLLSEIHVSPLLADGDTGIGIPKEKHDMIFASLTQVDASTTRMFGGTGLGLAISKQLVAKMGGEIGLSSALGEGSVFWFTVDLAIGATPIPEAGERASAGVRSYRAAPGTRVLLVEDNAINQMVAGGFLRRFGLEVDIAANGRDAVKMAVATAYAMIFMDVQMRGMNGYDTTREIQKSWAERGCPRAPIVAMTANAMAHDRDLCLQAGMDDYLSKPFSPEALEAQLRRWLGAREVG